MTQRDTKNTWALSGVSGGMPSNAVCTFSLDAKYLFTCNHAISVYSVASGNLTRKLFGHKSNISSLIPVPQNVFQLYSSSLDGTIKLWDYLDGKEIKSYSIGSPIVSMFPTVEPGKFVLILKKSRKWCISRCTLSANVAPVVDVISTVNSMPQLAVINKDFTRIAFSNKKVFYTVNLETGNTVSNNVSDIITALEFAPNGKYVYIGIITGQILVHEINSFRHIQTMHWHHHGVHCLSAGEEGYLLSGGTEGTVTTWNLENRQRTYFAHLGSSLSHFALATDYEQLSIKMVGNSFVPFDKRGYTAVVLSSCTIVILDRRTLNVVTRIEELKREWIVDLRNMIVEDDTTSDTICLRSDPYALQFYNINGKMCREIEVAPRTPLDPTYTIKMAYQKNFYGVDTFALCGKWLITFSTLHSLDVNECGELQFFVKEGDTYYLTTKSMFKHTEKVVCIKVTNANNTPIVCTTTNTGKVYLWEPQQKAQYWVCVTEFKLKHKECQAAAFSTDMSLLVLAYGNEIAMYSPTNHSFLGSMIDLQIGTITHLAFIKDTPFLVAVSTRGLTVYSVIEQHAIYCYTVTNVLNFAMDKDSDTFAVIAELAISQTMSAKKKKKGTKKSQAAKGAWKKEARETDNPEENQEENKTKEAEKLVETKKENVEPMETEKATAASNKNAKEEQKSKLATFKTNGKYILLFSGTSSAPYDVIALEKHIHPTACAFVKGEGQYRSLVVMLKDRTVLRYEVRSELQKRGAVKEEESEASAADSLTAAIIKQLTSVPEDSAAPQTTEVSGVNDMSAKEAVLRTHLGVSVTAMQDPEVLFDAIVSSFLTKEVEDSLYSTMDVEKGDSAAAAAAKEEGGSSKAKGVDSPSEDKEEFLDITTKVTSIMSHFDQIFDVPSSKKTKGKGKKPVHVSEGTAPESPKA